MTHTERENFYRNSTLIVDHTNESFTGLLHHDLTKQGLSLLQFIQAKQHEIYHLCYNIKPCCMCPPGSRAPVFRHNNRILNPAQLDILLDTTAKIPGHHSNSQTKHCCCPANPNITYNQLDLTLTRCLLLNFTTVIPYGSPERLAVDELIRFRNESYGHATEGKISDHDYQINKAQIEKSIMVLAQAQGRESEFKQKLSDAAVRPLDETILRQYQTKLMENIEIMQTLKNIESAVGVKSLPDCLTKDLRDVTVTEGCDAHFEIRTREYGLCSLWLRDEVEIERSQKFIPGESGKIHVLDIRNTSLSDKGQYTVRIKDIERHAHLDVEEYFTKNLQSVKCVEGDTAELTCEVKEDSLPACWNKNGIGLKDDGKYEILQAGKIHRLSIKNCELHDTAKYAVSINNRVRETFLVVIEYFTKPLGTMTCMEGETVQFECEVLDNQTALWFKDGSEVSPSDKYKVETHKRLHRLVVLNTRLADMGEYSVKIKNCVRHSQLIVLEYFTKPLGIMTCMEGETVQFECEVLDNQTALWFKDGSEVSPSDKYKVETHERLHRLVVINTRLADMGEYSVKIKNCVRHSQLIVQEYFTKNLQSVECVEEDTAEFTCEVKEDSLPAHWNKNGIGLKDDGKYEILQAGKLHRLSIKNCKLHDTAKYAVSINNRVRETSLVVIEYFTKPLGTMTCMEGETVQFECEVLDNQTALWFKDGSEVSPSDKYKVETHERLHRLVVTNTRLADMGEYSVKIKNCVRHSQLIVLEYFTKPLGIMTCMEGETVQFECEVLDNQTALWFKDGSEVSPSDKYKVETHERLHRLVVINTRLADMGEYSVKIKNCVRHSQLIVQEYFTKNLQSVECVEEDTAEFTCEVKEDSLPAHWNKNGIGLKDDGKYEILQAGKLHRLSIKNCKLHDTAKYAVSINNRVRETSLVVIEYFTKPLGTMTCMEGETVQFECEVLDNQTALWFKDGSEVSPSDKYKVETHERLHRLVVTNTRLADMGEYSVKIKNCVRHSQLIVQEYFTKNMRSTYEYIEGDIVELSCAVLEYNVTAHWEKDGVGVQHGDRYMITDEGKHHKLTIQHINLNDAGDYCVKICDRIRSTSLNVKEYFTKPLSTMTCLEGETVQFECEVLDDQTALWFKDGSEVITSDRYNVERDRKLHRLVVNNTRLDDVGKYSVKIKHCVRHSQLIVQEIPKVIQQLSEKDKELYMEIIKSGTEMRYYIRIVIIGENGVGKTCLLRRLLRQSMAGVQSTDGVDIHRCKINLSNGQWIFDHVSSKKKELLLRLKKAKNSSSGDKNSLLENYPQSSYYVTGLQDDENSHSNIRESTGTNRNSSERKQTLHDKLEDESVNSEFQEQMMTPMDNISDDKEMETESTSQLHQDLITKLLNKEVSQALDDFFNGIEEVDIPSDIFVECGILDFAGEKEYYATHPIFLNPNALHLLVANIMKDVQPINTEEGFDKIGEYIEFWLDSIHCCGVNDDSNEETQTEFLYPPTIIVCTRIDECRDRLEKRKQVFCKQLGSVLRIESKKKHIREICYVSNTESKEEDICGLRDTIFKYGKQLKTFAEQLPLKWMRLEHLIDVFREAGVSILSWPDILKLSSKCSIESHDEINLFLKYQHKVGGVIYFESLKEYIILNQKWLANAFRCLVSDKFNTNLMLSDEYRALVDTGKLEHSLIVKLFDKEPELNFSKHSGHILNVMEIFGIIVKLTTLMENGQRQILPTYYMPCMISEKASFTDIIDRFNAKKDNCKRTPWLCIEFDFMPFDFFNHILCHFISKYPVCTEPQNGRMAIYHGMGVFFLDNTKFRKCILCFCKNTIALQIWQWKNVEKGRCKTMLEELVGIIERVKDRFETRRVSYTVKSKCTDGIIHISAGCQSYSELVELGDDYFCEEHSESHNTQDFFQTWFEDYTEHKDYVPAHPKLKGQEVNGADRKMTQEQENFNRHSTVIVDETKDSFLHLLDFHLTNQGITLQRFIEINGHDIYHLCFNRYPCCQCPPGTRTGTRGSRVLHPPQLDILFDKTGNKLLGHYHGSKSAPHCCYPVNPNLQLQDLDFTLARLLLVNFTTLVPQGSLERVALDKLVNSRNHSFAHATEGKISNSEYQKLMADVEASLLVLAKVYTKEAETKQKLRDIAKQPLNIPICLQLQNTLLEQQNTLLQQCQLEETIKRLLPECLTRDLEDIRVVEGCDATFEIWTRERNIIVEWLTEDNRIEVSDKFVIETSGVKHTLVVRNADLMDGGIYTAKLEGCERSARLYIDEYFTKNMKRAYEYIEGDIAELSCAVREDNVTAQWERDGVSVQHGDKYMITDEGRNHKLAIQHITLQDAGDYSVKICDRLRSTSLQVREYFTKTLSTMTCVESETAQFECEVLEENQTALWFKDDTEVSMSDKYRIERLGRLHRLVINNTRIADTGKYSVKIKNCARYSQLNVQGKTIRFQVAHLHLLCHPNKMPETECYEYFTKSLGSVTCFEGETVQFECEVLYENQAAQWFKDGTEVSTSDKYKAERHGRLHTLVIINTKLDDNGEYFVKIKNCVRHSQLFVQRFKSTKTPSGSKNMKTQKDVPVEAKDRHARLITDLDNWFPPTQFKQLKTRLQAHLDHSDLSNANDIMDIVESLEKKGKVAPGRYKILKTILMEFDTRIVENLIEPAEQEICQMIDNSKTPESCPGSDNELPVE